jgi:hypothetical protein
MQQSSPELAEGGLGHPLDKMFSPHSIALVGATEKSFWSKLILQNYPVLGFTGKVFAVNRRGEDVLGVRGFASCTAIGEPVDLPSSWFRNRRWSRRWRKRPRPVSEISSS